MFAMRELESDQDWDDYLHFHNLRFDFTPVTIEQLREYATHGPIDKKERRAVLLHNGVPVGASVSTHAFWYSDTGRFELRVFPGRGEGALERFATALDLQSHWAVENGATKLGVWAESRFPEEVAHLVNSGFKEGQRNQELALDPATFDQSQWNLDEAKSKLGQIKIVSYKEASATDPDWEHKAWRLEMDVLHDVPLPEPFNDRPFEEFQRGLQDKTLNLDTLYCAIDGTEWVGLSQLHPNQVDGTLATTGLTGVVRTHRRRGLATALKLHSIAWASKNGIRRIATDNEEDNPMKALNDRLGYKPVFDWIEMTREV